MTHVTAPRRHTMTTGDPRRRTEHATRRTNGRPSASLISEAVVASYIHDIAQRHRGQPSVSRGALTRGPTPPTPIT